MCSKIEIVGIDNKKKFSNITSLCNNLKHKKQVKLYEAINNELNSMISKEFKHYS